MTKDEWKERCRSLGVEIRDFDSPEFKEMCEQKWKDSIEEKIDLIKSDARETLINIKSLVLQLWIIIAVILAIAVIEYRDSNSSVNRFHYKPLSGQMFDSKTGMVIDVETGKIEFEIK